jgi:hypothetical protein
MLTPGKGNWGLGVQIGGSEANPYFTHGGVNEGYESLFAAYQHEGEGAVVMTNAQGGEQLASELMRSIAAAYGWPDFQPVVRKQVKVAPSVLARYVGTYQLSPGFSITVTLDGDQLMIQATGQRLIPVFPESDTRFLIKVVDAELEFFPDASGRAAYVILHQNDREMKGLKK